MKKGQFIYLALSVLTGTVLALHLYWGAFFVTFFLLVIFLRKLPSVSLVVTLLLFAASFSLSLYKLNTGVTELSPFQNNFSITFHEPPVIDGDLLTGAVMIKEGEEVILRYKIPDEKQKNQLQQSYFTGLTCTISGELIEPGQARNENSFNYQKYLRNKGIYWLLQVDGLYSDSCRIEQQSILDKLGMWREKGLKSIEEKFPKTTSGITAALVFGHRNLLEENTLEAYQRLGIIHLLAISGLHVGMLFTILFFILLRAGVAREYVHLMLLFMLPLYVLLTGGAPPVIRASGIMAAVILFRYFKWKLAASDALSLVFILYLLLDPFILNNVGFQLSFLVSFSLVLSSHTLLKSSQSTWKSIFLVTAVCQVASLPVLLWNFYEFSLIGFVINSLYVPFFTIIMLPLALLSFLAMLLVPPATHLFFPVLEGTVWLSDFISNKLNNLPFITLTTGKPASLLLIIYVLLIVFLFVRAEKGKWQMAIIPLVLLLVLHKGMAFLNPYGELIMVDVGQGDSIIIKLPFNQGVYMIDTGGVVMFPEEPWQKKKKEFSISDDVLLPLLKSKGIGKIDKLILTHSDFDHAGAAEDLIGRIEIGEILITPGSDKKELMDTIVKKAKRAAIKVRSVRAGEKWSENSGDFMFLYPFDDHYEGNDDSLVLYGKFGGKTWMFTGDLEMEGEKELIEKWRVDIDVLKVGHHGSATSTSDDLLAVLTPGTALISAGKNNRYGHPDPDVIERLKKNKVKVYNTAVQGAIHFKFWGSRGTFTTVIP